MDVVFRTNNEGRIYGVTFIDHESRVALNGSRLGKEFSANMFHAWFSEGKRPISPQSPQQQNTPMQPFTNDNQRSDSEPNKSLDTSLIKEMFGIIDIKPHEEDYDEIAFARRKRKKKRKPKIQ